MQKHLAVMWCPDCNIRHQASDTDPVHFDGCLERHRIRSSPLGDERTVALLAAVFALLLLLLLWFGTGSFLVTAR